MDPAVAVVELVSIARGIRATDEMCKKAQVSLEESAVICPGKYLIVISGPGRKGISAVCLVDSYFFDGRWGERGPPRLSSQNKTSWSAGE